MAAGWEGEWIINSGVPATEPEKSPSGDFSLSARLAPRPLAGIGPLGSLQELFTFWIFHSASSLENLKRSCGAPSIRASPRRSVAGTPSS